MNNMYHELLSAWCNAMLSLQVRDINVPGIYGGIMCPACSRIHGRSADAVYPFLYMAHATSEERYLRAAIDLLAWSDHSSLPDGSWINEPTGNEWKGITVFGALALAEALRHHGEVLDESTRTRWEERLHRAAEFLDGFMTIHTGNINYPVSASAALAVAGEYFSESRYTDHARELAHQVLAYFSQDNKMLFGEGHPGDGITPRGCRAIDLGYNVEESLPALALYGRTVGDEEVLTMVTDSLRSHLEFMLPDGAWDNSWGARNYKWTYWGSRTSDGCHMACALLAGRDPHFAEAARRNTELLAACTHDGLLYGGPHYQEHGELPCVHHTFCHAKALAAALDYRMPESDASVALPREKAVGVCGFPEIGTCLIATGPWRATVTGYDWPYMPEGHASGGALSLLWHQQVGPIVTASLTSYSIAIEPSNMQPHRDPVYMALTPQLTATIGEKVYRSVNDYTANITCENNQTAECIMVTRGELLDADEQRPTSGTLPFTMRYRFTPETVEITVEVAGRDGIDKLAYTLPVISVNAEQISETPEGVMINKPKGTVIVNASIQPEALPSARIFNHVPGHEAVPIVYELNPHQPEQLQVLLKVTPTP